MVQLLKYFYRWQRIHSNFPVKNGCFQPPLPPNGTSEPHSTGHPHLPVPPLPPSQALADAAAMEATVLSGRHSQSPAALALRQRLNSSRQRYRPCLLSMNGCGGGGGSDGAEQPVAIRETRTLPAVAGAGSAVIQLKSAISALIANPPSCTSGIIRLQVPILKKATAIDWLHAQRHLPRCYFSSRRPGKEGAEPGIWGNGNGGHHGKQGKSLVSVAGVGSAAFFQGFDPFALNDWRCIKRFLSKDCPLLRAYGAIRFDAKREISTEWKDFGSFYFIVPQVEFDEFEAGSMLASTIAWDDSLLWTWKEAINELQNTISEIFIGFDKCMKPMLRTDIISCSHVPNKLSWEVAVNKALDMIIKDNSDLVKVVLARCSRYVTDTVMNPIELLASLQVEGQDAFQFCIQPPDAPAFIGNTIICSEVVVNPRKSLRRLPRVQHLCADLSAMLTREDDEFAVLSSLHPTPAVCGLPLEEAREYVKDNEMFDRGMFAGPVGWFGGRESEFAVGIRSALVGQDMNTLVYAGAGIVQGTNPSSEWDELNLKTSQFTKILEHDELLSSNPGQKEIKNVATA
ncbi:Isochorismate synthase 2, chloroplastic [Apostasia shenzhenica]|uniref:Isochorismate synthase 2, chloroplastic n=1 Tax=Apostasia shenzhenica TaxID=1088818 RepID=A0A2I0AP46_9ASPA|nr:Isochorismate synthase 2, chloroplastic [Apostasia shenzhenica]